MKSVIIYGSRYGSSRRYAEQLSALTGIPAVSFEDDPPVSGVETPVYIGGLYAGGVLGLKKTFRSRAPEPGQRLIVATVGLADPLLEENVRNIRVSLRKQLSSAWLERAGVFHLRGAINYRLLSPGHRAVMALLYRSVRRTPVEKWSAEDRALADTYGKCADFVDFSALAPLVRALGLHGPA